MKLLSQQILEEYKSGKLDFVKGVLVALGIEDTNTLQNRLIKIKSVATSDQHQNPHQIMQHLRINFRDYWSLFEGVDIPQKGYCLINTILRNTWLSYNGFDSSVLRIVHQSKEHFAEEDIGYHIATLCCGERIPEFGISDESLIHICNELEFDNNSLVAYTYYQRANRCFNKGNNDEAVELYNSAIQFNSRDFLMWEQLADAYKAICDLVKTKKCEAMADSLRPNFVLLKPIDKKPYIPIF